MPPEFDKSSLDSKAIFCPFPLIDGLRLIAVSGVLVMRRRTESDLDVPDQSVAMQTTKMASDNAARDLALKRELANLEAA